MNQWDIFEKLFFELFDRSNNKGNNILKIENKCWLGFVIKAKLEMAETNSKG